MYSAYDMRISHDDRVERFTREAENYRLARAARGQRDRRHRVTRFVNTLASLLGADRDRLEPRTRPTR